MSDLTPRCSPLLMDDADELLIIAEVLEQDDGQSVSLPLLMICERLEWSWSFDDATFGVFLLAITGHERARDYIRRAMPHWAQAAGL